MTTNELIKQVLEHDAKATPLLARKLQRAMEVVAYALDSEGEGMYLSCADLVCLKGEPSEHSGHCIVKRAADALADIEAMQ